MPHVPIFRRHGDQLEQVPLAVNRPCLHCQRLLRCWTQLRRDSAHSSSSSSTRLLHSHFLPFLQLRHDSALRRVTGRALTPKGKAHNISSSFSYLFRTDIDTEVSTCQSFLPTYGQQPRHHARDSKYLDSKTNNKQRTTQHCKHHAMCRERSAARIG